MERKYNGKCTSDLKKISFFKWLRESHKEDSTRNISENGVLLIKKNEGVDVS